MRARAMRMQQIPSEFTGFEVFVGKIVALGLSIVAVYKAVKFVIGRIQSAWATLKEFGGSIEALTKLNEGVALQTARLATIIEMDSNAFFTADPAGRIIIANASLLRLMDTPLTEIQGQGWENLVHNEDYLNVSQGWDEAIREKRQFLRTYRIVTPRDTIRVRVWARPVFSTKNELIEFQGTVAEVGRRPVTQT